MSELFQDDNNNTSSSNNNNNINTKRRIFNNSRGGRYLHPHSSRGSRSHADLVLNRLGVTDLREHLERKKESDLSSPGPPPDPSFGYLKDPLREARVPDRELKRSQSYGKIEGKFNRNFTSKDAATPSAKTKRSTKENRTNFQGREESESSFLKNPYNIQIELKTESGERTYVIDENNKLPHLGPNPGSRDLPNKTANSPKQGYSNFKQTHHYSGQNFSNRGRGAGPGASRGRGAARGRVGFDVNVNETGFSQRPHFNKQHQYHHQHQNQYQPRNKKNYKDNNDQNPRSEINNESWDQEIAENQKRIKDEEDKKQEVENETVCDDDGEERQHEPVTEDKRGGGVKKNVKENREKCDNGAPNSSDSDNPRGIIACKNSHEKKKKVTIKDS